MEACRIIGFDVSQALSLLDESTRFSQNDVRSHNNEVRIYLIEITQHREKENYWLVAH